MPQTNNPNDVFIFKMFDKIGFGDYFNDAYLKGKEARLPEIPFQPGKLDFDGGVSLIVLPKVVEEKKTGEGFYVMKGYQATRQQEGKEDVSQFFSVYKTIGLNVDQANELLRGSAVRHLLGYKDNTPQFGYSQINFEERTANNNYKIMKRDDDGSLVKTLGMIGIIARQDEKEKILERLQTGERVPVNIRTAEGARQLHIQAAVLKSGPGINLFDGSNMPIKQYPEAVVRRMQPLQTVGDDGPKIPPKTLDMVTTPNKEKPGKEKKNSI